MKNFKVYYKRGNEELSLRIYAMDSRDARRKFYEFDFLKEVEISRILPENMDSPYINDDGEIEYK